MDYEKSRLTPLTESKTPAENAAKAAEGRQLKMKRAQTQRYKQKYFEYYDDVKINHREDW